MSAQPARAEVPPLDDATLADIAEATQSADQIDRFLKSFSALAKLSILIRDLAALQNLLGENRRRLAAVIADEAAASERLAEASVAITRAENEAASITAKATADADAVVSDAQAQADKIFAKARADAARITGEAKQMKSEIEASRRRLAEAVKDVA